ncbi:MAG: riboflavin synthase [bacterium]|nr:riboflavin synthase [bacterium]
MFTGIVEEIGKVVSLQTSGAGGRLVLEAEKVLEGTQLGDSILVNGACLTVSSLSGGRITMDLLGETLSKTNLGSLRRGDIVNLERSLTPQSRLGGHFVLGHVDGTGTITRFEKSGEDMVLEIEAEEEIVKRLAPKGSVAVDGMSLTVVSVVNRRFTVHIIPHTLSFTNLRERKPGDKVNIEVDVFARYLYDFLSRAGKLAGVTEETLRRAGFV